VLRETAVRCRRTGPKWSWNTVRCGTVCTADDRPRSAFLPSHCDCTSTVTTHNTHTPLCWRGQWVSMPRFFTAHQHIIRCIRIPESHELQELRQNIVKYSHFAAKIRKSVTFTVRVLIRFTCDSYVFAYVVYCILQYSHVIPVISVIPVIPVFQCTPHTLFSTIIVVKQKQIYMRYGWK